MHHCERQNDVIHQHPKKAIARNQKESERERYVTIRQVFSPSNRNSWRFERVGLRLLLLLAVASRGGSSVTDPSPNSPSADCRLRPQVIWSTNRPRRRTIFRRLAADRSSSACGMRRQIESAAIPAGNHPVWPGSKTPENLLMKEENKIEKLGTA